MMSLMHNAPDNVAAFRAVGDIDKADYTNVVFPAIERLLKKQDKINFLLMLDTDLKNFTAGALLSDLGVGLKHFYQVA